MIRWLKDIFATNNPVRARTTVPPVRVVRAGYDAAQTTPDNRRHWAAADNLSANAANSAHVRRTLRSRCRHEVANNSYARGIVLTLAYDTIGTGPRLQLLTPDAETNRRIERLFAVWSQLMGLPEKLRTMRMARASDGEAFAILTSNPRLPTPVQLDLRLVEAEQVTTPDLAVDAFRAVDGIVFDSHGNPIEYHVLRQHPGDAGFDFGYDRVPAESMLHYYRADRAGQARGIPDLTAALPLFAELRRYTLAVIAAAESVAEIGTGVIYSDAPADDGGADAAPYDQIELERRLFTVLPDGWKMNQLRAEQPSSTYGEFKREILNEIARCVCMPFGVAAANSSDYNYASGRLDWQLYHKSLRVERAHLESRLLDPLLRAWLDEAVLVPGLLPDGLGPMLDWPHQWFFDGAEHVDPAKEANAQATRLSSHTTTLADEYARYGQDWEVKLRQRAKELALMRELGLAQEDETFAPDETEDDKSKDVNLARQAA